MAKVGDKAVLEHCQAEHVKKMMPQHVGVGVKFMAELLAMGLMMVLHLRGGFILLNIDITNAYNEIKRAKVVGAHMRHTHFVKWVPYWRSKLGPTSKPWAGVRARGMMISGMVNKIGIIID